MIGTRYGKTYARFLAIKDLLSAGTITPTQARNALDYMTSSSAMVDPITLEDPHVFDGSLPCPSGTELVVSAAQEEDHFSLPWPPIESDAYLYSPRPAANGVIYGLCDFLANPLEQQTASHVACEDCYAPNTGTCDPVMTDNLRHWICEACCELRRQHKNWAPPKPYYEKK